MAVATQFTSRAKKRRIFELIIKSMGYHSLEDLIDNIWITDGGDPVAEDVAIHDYSFGWDPTNNAAWVHTTGTNFTQIGSDLTQDAGGTMRNAAASPNG